VSQPPSLSGLSVVGRTPLVEDGPGLPEYRTKSDVVYARLRHLVLTAEIRPGDVIDQASLSESLGVSRMPLRQALIRLASEGLVYLSPHHSATVVPLLARDIEEIYSTRDALESLLIRTATPKLTPRDDVELAGLCREAGDPAIRMAPRHFSAADRRFHTRLYQVAGFPRALQYFMNLRDLSDRFVAFYYSQERPSRDADAAFSTNCHDEMLEACRARDVDAAVAAMRTDLWRTAEFLLEVAESSPPGD